MLIYLHTCMFTLGKTWFGWARFVWLWIGVHKSDWSQMWREPCWVLIPIFFFFLRNNILDPYSSRVMIQEPTEGMSPRSVVSVKWVLGSPSDPLFLLIQQRSLCLALTFVICSYPYTTLTTVNSSTGCPVKHILSPYEVFIHVCVYYLSMIFDIVILNPSAVHIYVYERYQCTSNDETPL